MFMYKLIHLLTLEWEHFHPFIGFAPVLGRYQTLVENRLGSQLVISQRTGWVSPSVLPGLIPGFSDIKFEISSSSGSLRIGIFNLKF
jgi:hypothetical protein